MISKKVNCFIVNLLQYASIVSFQYNETKNRFENSKNLLIYSKCFSVVISIFLIYSVFTFFSYTTHFSDIGSIDKIMMKISFFTAIIYSFTIIYEKFFKISDLIIIMNRLISIDEELNCHNYDQLTKTILKLLFFELLVLPLTMMAADITFFISYLKFTHLSIASCLISVSMNWTISSIGPICLSINYMTFALKNINRDIATMNYGKTVRIRELSEIYRNLVETFDDIIKFYQLHIIAFIIVVSSSLLWQLYAVLDILIIRLTISKIKSNMTAPFYGINAFISYLQLSLFSNMIEKLHNENQKTIELMNNLDLRTCDNELKRNVSEKYKNLKFMITIQ